MSLFLSLPAAITRETARKSFRALFATVSRSRQLARQRKALLRLDTHLLTDIGISRAEAEAEAESAFWDAPAHWHQSGKE